MAKKEKDKTQIPSDHHRLPRNGHLPVFLLRGDYNEKE